MKYEAKNDSRQWVASHISDKMLRLHTSVLPGWRGRGEWGRGGIFQSTEQLKINRAKQPWPKHVYKPPRAKTEMHFWLLSQTCSFDPPPFPPPLEKSTQTPRSVTSLLVVLLDRSVVRLVGWFRVALAGVGQVHDAKCLHAHVADALMRGRDANAIGRLTLEVLEARSVPTDGGSRCSEQCNYRVEETDDSWRWGLNDANRQTGSFHVTVDKIRIINSSIISSSIFILVFLILFFVLLLLRCLLLLLCQCYYGHYFYFQYCCCRYCCVFLLLFM